MVPRVKYTCKSASGFFISVTLAGFASISLKKTHAFVTMKLDYCNALMYGLPKYLTKRLQHVQNAAARLRFLSRLNLNILHLSLLAEFHWLPVEHRRYNSRSSLLLTKPFTIRLSDRLRKTRYKSLSLT
jgi:hypothetical protein